MNVAVVVSLVAVVVVNLPAVDANSPELDSYQKVRLACFLIVLRALYLRQHLQLITLAVHTKGACHGDPQWRIGLAARHLGTVSISFLETLLRLLDMSPVRQRSHCPSGALRHRCLRRVGA